MIDRLRALEKGMAELPKFRNVHFQIMATPDVVLAIVPLLQLALRHPHIDRTATAAPKLARKFCDELIAKIGTVCPDTADLLRMGFDPVHDVPTPTGDHP